MHEEMRTFGYLCPHCGQTVMAARSVFALAASNAEVPCPCGKSALRVTFDGQADLSRLRTEAVRDGDAYILTYEPSSLPTSELLSQVLAAGAVREMTLKEQNVDELIARMYREMAL